MSPAPATFSLISKAIRSWVMVDLNIYSATAFENEGGQERYVGAWALSRAEERAAFEQFIDFVMDRLRTYPDLHIYHFALYEPAALKRLMGRYATREDELDRSTSAWQTIRGPSRCRPTRYPGECRELFHQAS